MSCQSCEWLADRLRFGKRSFCDDVWRDIYAWEESFSNANELWLRDTDRNRELNRQADELRQSDSEAALQLNVEAAEGGSVWAMEEVGSRLSTRDASAASLDRARECYRRAMCAGSQLAALEYAKLSVATGRHEEGEATLRECVALNFIPAFSRYAMYRYRMSPTRATAQEVRSLLEQAAANGHPVARAWLVGMALRGKFGFREVFLGLLLLGKWLGGSREGREVTLDRTREGPLAPK